MNGLDFSRFASKYPNGGNPTKTISGINGPYGVTVSVVPSR